MKPTTRLLYLLLKLAVGTMFFVASAPNVLAQAIEEPLISISKAIVVAQTSAEDFYKQGNSLFNRKRYEEALDAYDKAIQINNYQSDLFNLTGADSWYARGVSLFALKRYQEAVNSFDKAISLRPNFNDAVKARQVAQKWLR